MESINMDNSLQNLEQGTLIRLSAFLHTLSCQKPHIEAMEDYLNGRKEGYCYYFIEEMLAGDQKDHQEWLERTRAFCVECKLTPEEALRVLPKIVSLRRSLQDIIERSPTAVKLCRLVLFDGLF